MSFEKYLRTVKREDLTIERIIAIISNRIIEIPHILNWILPFKYSRENKLKLGSFKDIHKGKRCFIIANGPSLRNTNLNILKDEITICMNRGHLLSNLYDFTPTYLFCIDVKNQLNQFTEEYNSIDIVRFYNWNARKLFNNDMKLVFLRLNHKHIFQKNVLKGFWYGHSVTFACIELAYYMGFNEVVLVGKDHNFIEKGYPHKKMISTRNEDNHFIKGYYKEGMRWDIPDYLGEEIAYRLANNAFEKEGRKILDATIDGKLEIFKKVQFLSLFGGNENKSNGT
jgi:hypothetical protein